jgi:hypothetical protein
MASPVLGRSQQFRKFESEPPLTVDPFSFS